MFEDDMSDTSKVNATGNETNVESIENFALTKNDPKYQTLPYNTKFTINLLTRISKADQYSNYGNIKEECFNHISNNINKNFNLHMAVHSAPLNVLNRNVAVPLHQNDFVKKDGESKEPCSCNDAGSFSQEFIREGIQHSPMNKSSLITNMYQVSK